jgi:hypothetical protein
MKQQLYLLRAYKQIEGRAYDPEKKTLTEFSNYNLVIAENPIQSSQKFLHNLKKGPRSAQKWHVCENYELIAGKKVSLETRVKIIGEMLKFLANDIPLIK